MRSKDFIFKTLPSGDLKFIGKIEEFYKFDDDPWQQSGNDGEMSTYYKWSRERLLQRLDPEKNDKILEVGCGLGYLTKLISDKFPSTICDGTDISKTAVNKASKFFPELTFFQENICSKKFKVSRKYDFILLSQILWYIVESFPVVINNCNQSLNENGKLIITQAFLKQPQRYARDIVDGFFGLEQYLIKNLPNSLNISLLDYDSKNDFVHHDGIVIINKDKNIN